MAEDYPYTFESFNEDINNEIRKDFGTPSAYHMGKVMVGLLRLNPYLNFYVLYHR